MGGAGPRSRRLGGIAVSERVPVGRPVEDPVAP
jgi:hypothetical protein